MFNGMPGGQVSSPPVRCHVLVDFKALMQPCPAQMMGQWQYCTGKAPFLGERQFPIAGSLVHDAVREPLNLEHVPVQLAA